MEEFIRSSVEWQAWGINPATISAIGATILTFFQGWSFIKQGQAVWRTKSGNSVSVRMFSYLFFYFMAFIVYAVHAKSIVMFVNGMLFLCIIPVLCGLRTFKGFTQWEQRCFLLFSSMPILMMVLSQKKILFFVLLFGIVIALMLPAWEIWRARARGVVDPVMSIVGMVTNVFWTVYALTGAHDLPLIIVNPTAFTVSAITLWLWIRYPNTVTVESEAI